MSNASRPPRAPHVQAAIAAGQARSAQTKAAEPPGGRPLAAHSMAAHVQAAIASGQGRPVQPKAADPGGGSAVAAHVQAAVGLGRGGAMQPKVAAPGDVRRSLPGGGDPHRSPTGSRSTVAQPALVKGGGGSSSSGGGDEEWPRRPRMKSQFWAEGKIVDLNCGRYCAAYALKAVAAKFFIPFYSDPFKEALPAPTGKTSLSLKVGWSPGVEGAAYFHGIHIPQSCGQWNTVIENHGPVIVSGKLGAANWGILGGVGHYIVIVGVNLEAETLLYLDPLSGDTEPKSMSLATALDRIERAYIVNRAAMWQVARDPEILVSFPSIED